jgi:hypothetical protein
VSKAHSSFESEVEIFTDDEKDLKNTHYAVISRKKAQKAGKKQPWKTDGDAESPSVDNQDGDTDTGGG